MHSDILLNASGCVLMTSDYILIASDDVLITGNVLIWETGGVRGKKIR